MIKKLDEFYEDQTRNTVDGNINKGIHNSSSNK